MLTLSCHHSTYLEVRFEAEDAASRDRRLSSTDGTPEALGLLWGIPNTLITASTGQSTAWTPTRWGEVIDSYLLRDGVRL